MPPRDGEIKVAERVPPEDEFRPRPRLAFNDVPGNEIGVAVEREGQGFPRLPKRGERRRQDRRPRPGKIGFRRSLQRGEIGKEIDVIVFEIEQQRVGRREREKRVRVLARLDEKDAPPADAVGRAVRQRPARDRRRGKPRAKKNRVEHRRHGGFPVAACDRHADRAVLHKIRQEIRTGDQGDPSPRRLGKGRVIGRRRRRVDYGGNPVGKPSPLGKDPDPGPREPRRDPLPPIFARDAEPPQGGEPRKRGHPDAPDPEKPEERPRIKQTRRPLGAAQRVVRHKITPADRICGGGRFGYSSF